MPKTLVELHILARERKMDRIAGLSCGELEVLFYNLNRIRYSLKEEEEFTRFYLAVHSAIVECREGRWPAATDGTARFNEGLKRRVNGR